MILIADSGSTKTDWCFVNGQNVKHFTTQGINPFQIDEHQIISIINNELYQPLTDYGRDCKYDNIVNDIKDVYFYGAGCTDFMSNIVATSLRKALNNKARIFVKSDLLGAAKGLCANNPGIVCILGTGSNSCYYDGNDIVDNVPPLGFILGDEGSGAYIGKKLVANCLKKQFSDKICKMFFEESKLNQQIIIQKVYREYMPNRFLAQISTFCARHRDVKEIHDFVVSCFVQFFIRNVNLYNIPELDVSFVGSIAWFYQEELKEAAKISGFKIGKIQQSPMSGLLQYHAQFLNEEIT